MPMVDGSYIYDDGRSCIWIAEAGFSPDRGGNYIYTDGRKDRPPV